MCVYSGLRVSNGLGDWGSIPGRVIPKTLKMVFDAALLKIQHYKARIKGKVEQSWECSAPLHLDVVAIEMGDYGCQIYLLTLYIYVYDIFF